jgi:hypothetical protein
VPSGGPCLGDDQLPMTMKLRRIEHIFVEGQKMHVLSFPIMCLNSSRLTLVLSSLARIFKTKTAASRAWMG